MKLIQLALVLIVTSAHAQEVHTYTKIDDNTILTSPQRSGIFYPYVINGQVREQRVTVNGIEYHFLNPETSGGQREEIIDVNLSIICKIYGPE